MGKNDLLVVESPDLEPSINKLEICNFIALGLKIFLFAWE